MTDINTIFTRRLLSLVHDDVRKAFPDVNLQRSISLVGPSFGQFFVQIDVAGYPQFNDYYCADNRYEAKAKAWQAFFKKYAPEQIKREIGYDEEVA